MATTFTRAHGNTAVPERLAGDGRLEQVGGRPWTDVVGLATGYGKTFRVSASPDESRPLHSNWFHIAIPTITRLADRDMFLENFYFFFTSDSRSGGQPHTVFVSQIDVWDGSTRIIDGGPMPDAFSGNWASPREEWVGPTRVTNTFSPRNPAGSNTRWQIFTALSLSIGVAAVAGSGNITFHSAGATWTDRQQG
ncbi:MAG TPA: hypothetical protein VG318_06830 [Actinomycetota bacterium]|nr:hypothetical protein [Actinomycetota bacterium]